MPEPREILKHIALSAYMVGWGFSFTGNVEAAVSCGFLSAFAYFVSATGEKDQ
ncbi:hypothetical protein [Vibrio atypicus]|jgi:hypothetical protein|uniref:hypothetical protein n=1 Tax=Vibrio atypicus TaxID=558271 RepID=UPI001359156A|nr:hypothetical protein [Vibrio atypicus]